MWIPLLLLPWWLLSFVAGEVDAVQMSHRACCRRRPFSIRPSMLSDPPAVRAIKLTGLRVPKYAILGQAVQLECPYEMEGDELYSVRWYKDGNEFYRFVPRDKPEMQVFPQRGVSVNVS